MKKKISSVTIFLTVAGLIILGVAPAHATSSVTVTSPITVIGNYNNVAVANDGSLVAVSSMDDGLTIYDVKANSQVSIPMASLGDVEKIGYPAFSPDNKWLYVAAASDNKIIVIDLLDNSVNRSIGSFNEPWALTASQDGNSLYVQGYGDGDIHKIDLSNNDTVTGPRWTEGRTTLSMCLSADGTTLYSPNFKDGTVAVIDTSDMSQTTLWFTGTNSEPNSCTTDNEGNLIVGLFGFNTVIKFAPDGSSVVAELGVTTSPFGAAASCDVLYAASTRPHSFIGVLNLSTLAAETPLTVAENPSGSMFYAYSAARSLDGSVVAIGGQWSLDGLVIVHSPGCVADTPPVVPALANTGVDNTNLGQMVSGAALLALLGAGVLTASRRRAVRG